MITPIKLSNDLYYEKVKQGNRVIGYNFYWTYSAYPKVATAEEIKEIQEKIDKNPQILKVAKDIVNSNKKSKKKKTNNNNINQRQYSIEDLADLLLNN